MQHHILSKMVVPLLADPENTVVSSNIAGAPARVVCSKFSDGAVRPARGQHAIIVFLLVEVF